MSFEEGNPKDGKHYWLTPPEILETLESEFNFNFDPCPYPLPESFNGLEKSWGQSSYVNPPFTVLDISGKKKGFTAWARKAIEENNKGKSVVMVLPMHGWVHLMVNAGAELRSLGNVKWLPTEGGPGKYNGSPTMAFILKGKK